VDDRIRRVLSHQHSLRFHKNSDFTSYVLSFFVCNHVSIFTSHATFRHLSLISSHSGFGETKNNSPLLFVILITFQAFGTVLGRSVKRGEIQSSLLRQFEGVNVYDQPGFNFPPDTHISVHFTLSASRFYSGIGRERDGIEWKNITSCHIISLPQIHFGYPFRLQTILLLSLTKREWNLTERFLNFSFQSDPS